jgi:phenylpyruvate tautomerase PptA (4-oxalocrotonate tautomerase family)
MPMMTVQHPPEALTSAQKDMLAEDLTQVILQIEGGADTPAGRSIAWVRFQPIARDDWYLGGRNDAAFEAAAGRWLIELNVPEGSMNQDRKSDCHRAITKAILDITGKQDVEGAARSIWIQIFEWPEGHLATSGRTSSLLGIERAAAERTVAEQRERVIERRQSVAKAKAGDGPLDVPKTGWARLDKGVEKANKNPGLLAYKLQNSAYKYSWLLIILSTPVVALLFLWRRRFGLYDHAVFVTYSLTFMMLFVVVLILADAAGASDGAVAIAATVLPPLHIYKQLRGAYSLRRSSALWRTMVLVVFAGGVLLAWFLLLLVQGLTG